MSTQTQTETLESLFAWLDGLGERPPVEALQARLNGLEVDLDKWSEYVRFNEDRYRRNLVHEGPAYHALFLCWKSGQRSPIHDHAQSVCGVRILRGVATETKFAASPCGLLRPTTTVDHAVDAVCVSVDSDIHQISNLQAEGGDLLTLHIYAPPLLSMKCYSLTDARVTEFRPCVDGFVGGAGI